MILPKLFIRCFNYGVAWLIFSCMTVGFYAMLGIMYQEEQQASLLVIRQATIALKHTAHATEQLTETQTALQDTLRQMQTRLTMLTDQKALREQEQSLHLYGSLVSLTQQLHHLETLMETWQITLPQ